jgi:hypothetical protein
MLQTSDDIEALHAKLADIDSELKKLGQSEVPQGDATKSAAAVVAREWLKHSRSLREAGICDAKVLTAIDAEMQEVLETLRTRVRASALRSKWKTFLASAISAVVVPLIQHEGSPRQVASRQLLAEFGTAELSPDEKGYVDEAARCVSAQCPRAAMIMLWAAGIARFHSAIARRGFDAFNKAFETSRKRQGFPFARLRDSASVSGFPELQRSKDFDLLVVGMELFQYDLQVFQELDRLLGQRNSAAHPGMGQPTILDVQQFARKITAYIFMKVV